jgi:hypothetical protein
MTHMRQLRSEEYTFDRIAKKLNQTSGVTRVPRPALVRSYSRKILRRTAKPAFWASKLAVTKRRRFSPRHS